MLGAKRGPMTTDKSTAKSDAKEGGATRVLQRKPYRAPQLTTYGHISKLTMGQAGSGNDSATKKMAPCL